MQINELSGDVYQVTLPFAGIAAGSPLEVAAFTAPANLSVSGMRWLPAASITANGTNFFTLSLRNRGAAGSGTALPVSRSYAATNSTAWVGENCTLSATASDLLITAGDALTVQKVETASGLTCPAGIVVIQLRFR
jgi:hypothetical protein